MNSLHFMALAHPFEHILYILFDPLENFEKLAKAKAFNIQFADFVYKTLFVHIFSTAGALVVITV